MKQAWIACGVAAVCVAALLPGCPKERHCESDDDCPDYAYCDVPLGYCFTPEDGGADGGAGGDGGAGDGGDGGEDAGAPDAGPPKQPQFCSPSQWCWDNPRPSGHSHFAASSSSSDNVWVVGLGSTMRWNGTVWEHHPIGPNEFMTGVWTSSSTNAWAVGTGGLIKRWDGSKWSNVPSSTTFDLYAVFGLSPSEIWAVGAAGTILRWNGSSWSPEDSKTTVDLGRMWGASADDLWATTLNGGMLHRTANGWISVSTPAQSDIFDICGSSPTALWAVSEEGEVLRGNGSTWTVETVAPSALWGLACRGPNEAWAAGEGYMLHWNGTEWSQLPLNSKELLFTVVLPANAPGSGWAAGAHGELFRLVDGSWVAAFDDRIQADVTSLAGLFENSVFTGTSDGRILSCNSAGSCLQMAHTDAGAVEDLATPAPTYSWGIAGDRLLMGIADGWSERQLGSPLSGLAAWFNDGGVEEAWVVGRDLVQRCERNACDEPLDAGTGQFVDVEIDGSEVVVATADALMRCSPEAGCTPVTISEPVTINALWWVKPGVVWAACNGGKVVAVVGFSASVDQLPTTEDLVAITGKSDVDAWVSGRNGLIMHRSGTTWSEFQSGTSEALSSLHAFSATSVVAGGKKSMLLRFKP